MHVDFYFYYYIFLHLVHFSYPCFNFLIRKLLNTFVICVKIFIDEVYGFILFALKVTCVRVMNVREYNSIPLSPTSSFFLWWRCCHNCNTMKFNTPSTHVLNSTSFHNSFICMCSKSNVLYEFMFCFLSMLMLGFSSFPSYLIYQLIFVVLLWKII